MTLAIAIANLMAPSTEIIGRSPNLLATIERAKKFGKAREPVFISGETGVGKEAIAGIIHRLSPRSGGPYQVVNCAALPRDTMESALFGHTKGAFTGADRTVKGVFELAHQGTLFLDEVAELSLRAQGMLLRVVENGEVTPIGSENSVAVSTRLVVATHKDLGALVKQKKFREDLRFRLEVLKIPVPPLRERRGDIPLLIQHFLDKLNQEYGTTFRKPAIEELSLLNSYPFPGNVRELHHLVTQAYFAMEEGDTALSLEPQQISNILHKRSVSYHDMQRAYFSDALYQCRDKLDGPGGVAEFTGLNVNTLKSKLKKLRVDRLGWLRAM